ncbi:integrin alpha [Nonomuraea sp. CA-141351]|uniref:integrin alpha n=1 Tax=Nonomuraea sp. CA-141351 TaxID=3239996 RepID=UPI003D8F59FC
MTFDCSRASARDVDGDGRDDIAVLSDEGVYLLSAGKIVPLPAPEEARHDLSTLVLAHVNDDKCADVVVGAPRNDPSPGSVYIYYGGDLRRPTRLDSPQPQEGGSFGYALAAYGDLVAIGAPGEAKSRAGAVHLMRGGAILRTITQDSPGVPGNSEPLDEFGSALALGPMAGGQVSLAVAAEQERNDGPGRQSRKSEEGEGAVTVVHDLLSAHLSGARLKVPKIRQPIGSFGEKLVSAPGRGLVASAWGDDYGQTHLQFFDDELTRGRTVRLPSGTPLDSHDAVAMAPDGRVAFVIEVDPPFKVKIFSPSGPKNDRAIPLPKNWRRDDGNALAFSGNRLVLGRYWMNRVIVMNFDTGAIEFDVSTGIPGFGFAVAG